MGSPHHSLLKTQQSSSPKPMNTKQSQTLLAVLLAGGTTLSAQNAATPAAAATNDAASEIGLQQVVETHDGLSASAGYQFQFVYRDNPFYVDAPPTDAAKSRIMVHTFMGAVSLNDADSNNFFTDNTFGVLYQQVRYQEDLLKGFDYDTTSAFYKANINKQLGEWQPSIGIGYTKIKIDPVSIDVFDGFFPYLALTKIYPEENNSQFIAALKTSYGLTDIKGTSTDENRLDSWTTTATVGQHYSINSQIGLKSNCHADYSYYGEGSNSGRGDFLIGAGTSLYYMINKYLVADVFADYSKRFSNEDIYEYDNWDAGVKIGAMIQF
jgi:hypothetical protein